ncbi:hypothetical protein PO883_11665 [Massilia sp. DJPM01]|uniref:hypothetical protein n=1 Tax=Massilia sp. DJPM01 TaxID=3024404 RepID=UPI00259E356C|nr:hypothetical protein [Massilia sp. DJPM01]MDM5177848.1 hypothetical protein [Massilia sp. DJPM01]
MMSQENKLHRAAAWFDKAVASLPPAYKGLLAGAAFSALNDHGARESPFFALGDEIKRVTTQSKDVRKPFKGSLDKFASIPRVSISR